VVTGLSHGLIGGCDDGAFDQALAAIRLAGEMAHVCEAAENVATTPAALISAKTPTGKAQLAYMKAEIDYRVAHAPLLPTLGAAKVGRHARHRFIFYGRCASAAARFDCVVSTIARLVSLEQPTSSGQQMPELSWN